jgi:hypothetical protein
MMQFADYNAFRVAVQKLIEGDDTTGTFSVNTLDLLIGLGEARVYQGDAQTAGLRASTMEQPLSVVVTSNAAALPADLLELKEVYFSGKPPLDIIPLDRLRAMEAQGDITGADVRYAAQDGDTLRFWPQASGTVLGTYYAKPAALETVTWSEATTFARYPELYIFAALIESAPFLGMDARMQLWDVKFRSLADGANHSERMRVYGGGPLKMRVR